MKKTEIILSTRIEAWNIFVKHQSVKLEAIGDLTKEIRKKKIDGWVPCLKKRVFYKHI